MTRHEHPIQQPDTNLIRRVTVAWYRLLYASPFNSLAPMTEPIAGGTIVTININQEQPEEKVETTETTETETETTEKVEVTEKPADADKDE